MAGVSEQKTYVALTGINFKDGKRDRRVEPGEDLPSGLSQKDIEDLLAVKAIVVKGGDQK